MVKFLDFKNKLQGYVVFALNDVYKIYPYFSRLQLTRWQKQGYLQKIIKGYYVFQDLTLNEQALFLIANKIYAPSYVSCEMTLYYYGFIPENVYEITSVSSRTTYRFSSELANFSYQKIKPSLYWGYILVDYKNQKFKIAEPEKALLDYFYLNPHLCTEDDFMEMRFNRDALKNKLDFDKFKQYLTMFQNQALSKRVEIFLAYLSFTQSPHA